MTSSTTIKIVPMDSSFQVQNLGLIQAQRGASWQYGGESSYFRSMILQVSRRPTNAPNSSDYSVTLQTRPETRDHDEAVFSALNDHVTKTAQSFLVSNVKHMTSKETLGSFENQKFWNKNSSYPGYFYGRFNPNAIPIQILDREKSTPGNAVWKSIPENGMNFLTQESLVIIDFQPSIFFYEKKNMLYAFSVVIKSVRILYHNVNSSESAQSFKAHGELTKIAFALPEGYTGVEAQTEIPIINLDTFDLEKYTVSDPKLSTNGRLMSFASYSNARGRVYVRGRAKSRYGIDESDQYPGSRAIMNGSEATNENLFRVYGGVFAKLVDAVKRNSKAVYGEEYDAETIEDLCGSALFSKNDVDHATPRVSLKLPTKTDENGRPILPSVPDFQVFLVDHEAKTVSEQKYEDFQELEKILVPGTTYEFVALVRPVFINSKVYSSWKITQILVAPHQERRVETTMAVRGFAFHGYEEAEMVDRRSNANIAFFNPETLEFTEPEANKDNRVSFKAKCLAKDDVTSPYLCLPGIHKVSFDVGLVEDAKNNEFAFRLRFNCVDSQPNTQDLLDKIRDNLVTFCTKKSKDLFGAVKKEAVVKASVGRLVKFSKKDTEKTAPYFTVKCAPYEGESKLDIPFECYRFFPDGASGSIQKIDLVKKEDLLKIFFQGAWVQLIVGQRTWMVNGTAETTFNLIQAVLVPDPTLDQGIPFVDTTILPVESVPQPEEHDEPSPQEKVESVPQPEEHDEPSPQEKDTKVEEDVASDSSDQEA